jgi:hypothetical protein
MAAPDLPSNEEVEREMRKIGPEFAQQFMRAMREQQRRRKGKGK